MRTGDKRYHIRQVETADHNAMINGRNFFDQSIKNYIKTWNIKQIVVCQGVGYTTGCLLDYTCF